jgi:hypothetical protein
MARPKKVVATGNYKATLKVLGNLYTSDGSTAVEAISKLAPPLARGVSILTVTSGEKSQERVLPRVMTARLFSASKLVREIQLKHMSQRFDI